MGVVNPTPACIPKEAIEVMEPSGLIAIPELKYPPPNTGPKVGPNETVPTNAVV
jgi:hypothetical protein